MSHHVLCLLVLCTSKWHGRHHNHNLPWWCRTKSTHHKTIARSPVTYNKKQLTTHQCSRETGMKFNTFISVTQNYSTTRNEPISLFNDDCWVIVYVSSLNDVYVLMRVDICIETTEGTWNYAWNSSASGLTPQYWDMLCHIFILINLLRHVPPVVAFFPPTWINMRPVKSVFWHIYWHIYV